MTTKERIIRTAINLFSEKGYTETTVKEIGRGSGIKAASIYNHFESKKEILECILDEYSEYTRENVLSYEMISEKSKTEDPKKLLQSMFYRYEPENASKYSNILKIILHEHLRNEDIEDFFTKHFIIESENRLDFLLIKLIENNRINPVNHKYYAKILNSITLSMSLEYAHYAKASEYGRSERILMDEVLSFVIDLIINDKGMREGEAKRDFTKWIKPGGVSPEL